MTAPACTCPACTLVVGDRVKLRRTAASPKAAIGEVIATSTDAIGCVSYAPDGRVTVQWPGRPDKEHAIASLVLAEPRRCDRAGDGLGAEFEALAAEPDPEPGPLERTVPLPGDAVAAWDAWAATALDHRPGAYADVPGVGPEPPSVAQVEAGRVDCPGPGCLLSAGHWPERDHRGAWGMPPGSPRPAEADPRATITALARPSDLRDTRDRQNGTNPSQQPATVEEDVIGSATKAGDREGPSRLPGPESGPTSAAGAAVVTVPQLPAADGSRIEASMPDRDRDVKPVPNGQANGHPLEPWSARSPGQEWRTGGAPCPDCLAPMRDHDLGCPQLRVRREPALCEMPHVRVDLGPREAVDAETFGPRHRRR